MRKGCIIITGNEDVPKGLEEFLWEIKSEYVEERRIRLSKATKKVEEHVCREIKRTGAEVVICNTHNMYYPNKPDSLKKPLLAKWIYRVNVTYYKLHQKNRDFF